MCSESNPKQRHIESGTVDSVCNVQPNSSYNQFFSPTVIVMTRMNLTLDKRYRVIICVIQNLFREENLQPFDFFPFSL